MLIDYTYFFGDLAIGQLSEPAVVDKLNWYINQYEPNYLSRVLGDGTYNQLMADLLLMTIPQRWTDLIYGAAYTKDGYVKKWQGLIKLPANNSTVIDGANQIDIVVGRGRDEYDPAPSSPGVNVTTTIIPDSLVGEKFVFIQRGYGPLRADEFSVTGNILTLLGGLVFSANDTYFYFGNNSLIYSAGTDIFYKESPIANFVYYWYQRSQVTNTGGVGESNTSMENGIPASPKYKMAKAWNSMRDMNIQLYDFLLTNQTVYPEWFSWASVDDSNVPFLQSINVFNI